MRKPTICCLYFYIAVGLNLLQYDGYDTMHSRCAVVSNFYIHALWNIQQAYFGGMLSHLGNDLSGEERDKRRCYGFLRISRSRWTSQLLRRDRGFFTKAAHLRSRFLQCPCFAYRL